MQDGTTDKNAISVHPVHPVYPCWSFEIVSKPVVKGVLSHQAQNARHKLWLDVYYFN